MSKIELESFLKSFLLFSISLGTLFAILTYFQFNDKVKSVDNKIFNEMKLCSYDLKCKNFSIDFVEKSKQDIFTLYKNDKTIYSFFNISSSDSFRMKFSLKEGEYTKIVTKVRNEFITQYIFIFVIIVLISILFSFYALHPLRQALILTEEFIKDILQDFNTPLSALRLNASMLKREIGDNTKVLRIEQSVETVLSLQSNLKSYLLNQALQKEIFSIKEIVDDRIDFVSKIYPSIKFSSTIEDTKLNTNKDAFSRIVDNILTNAGKYNTKNGTVHVSYTKQSQILEIKDTGKGIKNVDKVFKRFYKEHDRGIGIGLHIVKKLSDELAVKIQLDSKIGEGTRFLLDLSSLTLD